MPTAGSTWAEGPASIEECKPPQGLVAVHCWPVDSPRSRSPVSTLKATSSRSLGIGMGNGEKGIGQQMRIGSADGRRESSRRRRPAGSQGAPAGHRPIAGGSAQAGQGAQEAGRPQRCREHSLCVGGAPARLLSIHRSSLRQREVLGASCRGLPVRGRLDGHWHGGHLIHRAPQTPCSIQSRLLG